MAPHDTNTPKEARRHKVPLIGMAVLVVLVFAGFVWWYGHETSGSDTREPGASIDQQAPAPATNP